MTEDIPNVDLKLYVQARNNAKGHLVRQYPNGQIYIFCNRFLGEVSGKIMTFAEADAVPHPHWQICETCQKSIEAALERAAVLMGQHPHEIALYAKQMQTPGDPPPTGD